MRHLLICFCHSCICRNIRDTTIGHVDLKRFQFDVIFHIDMEWCTTTINIRLCTNSQIVEFLEETSIFKNRFIADIFRLCRLLLLLHVTQNGFQVIQHLNQLLVNFLYVDTHIIILVRGGITKLHQMSPERFLKPFLELTPKYQCLLKTNRLQR